MVAMLPHDLSLLSSTWKISKVFKGLSLCFSYEACILGSCLYSKDIVPLDLCRFLKPQRVPQLPAPLNYFSMCKGIVPPELLNLRQVHSECTSCAIPSELKNFRKFLIRTPLVLLSFLDNSI
jgi:hypothetical protein